MANKAKEIIVAYLSGKKQLPDRWLLRDTLKTYGEVAIGPLMSEAKLNFDEVKQLFKELGVEL